MSPIWNGNFASFLTCGAVSILLVGCGIEGLEPRTTSAADRLPPAELSAVVFEGFTGGIRDAEVRASEARVDTERRIALLRSVEISFRDEHRGRVEIRADHGTFGLDTEDFSLGGGVVGRTAAEDDFSTEELEYEKSQDRLWTQTPVRLDRPSMTLHAEGMELELDRRQVRLTGKVEAIVGRPDRDSAEAEAK
jgi:LPS export ABC transporter protein LptC